MTIIRKRIVLPALLAGCLFVHQNCATAMLGTTQRVPVTSTPPGARVIVDSRYVGTTPISLRLGKKGDHVIKIEREGFAPVVISVRSNASGAFLLDGLLCFPIGPLLGVLLGLEIAPRKNIDEPKAGWVVAFGMLGVGLGIAAFAADAQSGANRVLSPAEVAVEMKKRGETFGPQIIALSREQWGRVNWIRVSCAK
jgi:hypothetical protein